MNDRRFSVRLLTGITIAAIGLDLPALAVPQAASPQATPLLAAQVACVVSKRTAVFATANPADPEVLGNTLAVGTPVALTVPLPTNPPARVQINPKGFVDYAALDCGRPTPPPDQPPTQPSNQKTTACRTVRNTIDSISVFREPKWTSQWIASVAANKPVYVIQSGGVTTSRLDVNGNPWVEVDLQRTFGKNFGIPSKVGWLPNTNPNDPSSSTLVNGCDR